MINNSLIHQIDQLHYGQYDPADAADALEYAEKLAWEKINQLLQIPEEQRTFANTVLGLTRSSRQFEAVFKIIEHLDNVLGEAWHQANLLATKKSSQFSSEVYLHEGIYQAVRSVADRHKDSRLTPAQNKLIQDLISDFERGGVNLPKEQKRRLKEINQELSSASALFSQNSTKAHDMAGITIKDRNQLAGLSDEFISDAAERAKQKHLDGYWVGYSEPNLVQVMGECSVRKTRQAMYRAVKTIGLEPNIPLAHKIICLRYEAALMLGYKNFADFRLEKRMSGSGDRARQFIADLTRAYAKKLPIETAELEAFARQLEGDPELKLDMTDIDTGLNWYYARQLREKQFDINESSIREYFSIDTVVAGMFEVLGVLYGVEFKKADEPVWHQDVAVYHLFDENKAQLATVWCDWFARAGKRGGAWMDAFYVAERAEGHVNRPHLGYVCANLQPPSQSKPSLLTIREVETIWHEFGHFMHFALGKTELIEQSMMNAQWDFIEAPSQIMQNWIWQPTVLQKIAKHYRSGKTIPLQTINKLIAARQYRAASKAARHMIFSDSDLSIHMDYADNPESCNPVQVYLDAKQRIYGLKPEPYDLSMMDFLHIFSGGYAAGYYSYKWAEAIEADLFSRFEQEGVLNPRLGREYRDKVLARGSEVDANQLVKDFLGRESTPEALLRRDGIID